MVPSPKVVPVTDLDQHRVIGQGSVERLTRNLAIPVTQITPVIAITCLLVNVVEARKALLMNAGQPAPFFSKSLR